VPRPTHADAGRRARRLLLGAGLASLLEACAPVALRPLPVGATHEAFAVSGRFAVRYPTAEGSQGANGRIEWRHTHAEDDLAIRDPIGSMVARIRRADTVYSLERPDQPLAQSLDPDALTEQVLGWRLPLRGMVWWLRGVIDPAVAPDGPSRLGEDGRAATLSQGGWQVAIRSRHTDTGLPERLEFTRGALQIRLFLPEWSEP
jgi:outer membrane lipoprotein LolB